MHTYVLYIFICMCTWIAQNIHSCTVDIQCRHAENAHMYCTWMYSTSHKFHTYVHLSDVGISIYTAHQALFNSLFVCATQLSRFPFFSIQSGRLVLLLLLVTGRYALLSYCFTCFLCIALTTKHFSMTTVGFMGWKTSASPKVHLPSILLHAVHYSYILHSG